MILIFMIFYMIDLLTNLYYYQILQIYVDYLSTHSIPIYYLIYLSSYFIIY